MANEKVSEAKIRPEVKRVVNNIDDFVNNQCVANGIPMFVMYNLLSDYFSAQFFILQADEVVAKYRQDVESQISKARNYLNTFKDE